MPGSQGNLHFDSQIWCLELNHARGAQQDLLSGGDVRSSSYGLAHGPESQSEECCESQAANHSLQSSCLCSLDLGCLLCHLLLSVFLGTSQSTQ